MRYVSVNNPSRTTSLHDAVFCRENPGQLYIPHNPAPLPHAIMANIAEMSLAESAYVLFSAILGEEIPLHVIRNVAFHSYRFPINIHKKLDGVYMPDLCDGPTHSPFDFATIPFANMLHYCKDTVLSDRKINIVASGELNNGLSLCKALGEDKTVELFLCYPGDEIASYLSGFESLSTKVHFMAVRKDWDECKDVIEKALISCKKDNLSDVILHGGHLNLGFVFPLIVPIFSICCRVLAECKHSSDITLIFSERSFSFCVASVIADQMGLPINIKLISGDDTAPSRVAEKYPYIAKYISLYPDKESAVASVSDGSPLLDITLDSQQIQNETVHTKVISDKLEYKNANNVATFLRYINKFDK